MLKDVVIIGDEVVTRDALFATGLKATSAFLSIGPPLFQPPGRLSGSAGGSPSPRDRRDSRMKASTWNLYQHPCRK